MNYIEMIIDALQYIESNLRNEITLGCLAKRYHMSQTHFYRIFRVVTNKTFKTYIQERRLSEAALEIKNSSRRVLDIALDWGFNSHESFIRSFHRFFSINPLEYRRKQVNLNIFLPIEVVERDFRNKNKDIIVDFQYHEIESIILYGKSIEFQPEDSVQVKQISQSIVRFVEEYIVGQEPNRLYSITISDCSKPDKIVYFYGAEADKLKNSSALVKAIVPKSKYAVFYYKGDMGTIFRTVINDLYRFLSVSDIQFNKVGIDLFEVYEEDYEDTNRFSIWIPIL